MTLRSFFPKKLFFISFPLKERNRFPGEKRHRDMPHCQGSPSKFTRWILRKYFTDVTSPTSDFSDRSRVTANQWRVQHLIYTSNTCIGGISNFDFVPKVLSVRTQQSHVGFLIDRPRFTAIANRGTRARRILSTVRGRGRHRHETLTNTRFKLIISRFPERSSFSKISCCGALLCLCCWL